MKTLRTARNARKALLLITDGGDNRSRYTLSEVKGRLEESDVQLYAIGIYEDGRRRNRTPEESAGPKLLTDLSEPTGGRHFIVENLADLPDVAAKIGVELHNQYVIGYTPGNLHKRVRASDLAREVCHQGSSRTGVAVILPWTVAPAVSWRMCAYPGSRLKGGCRLKAWPTPGGTVTCCTCKSFSTEYAFAGNRSGRCTLIRSLSGLAGDYSFEAHDGRFSR